MKRNGSSQCTESLITVVSLCWCVSRLLCVSGLNTLCVFCVSERSARRMTRALKNAVLQQQMIDVDKALQILDQEIPPLVVDRDKLKVCDSVGVGAG